MTASDAAAAVATGEPQKPKRAQGAYFIFSMAMREEVTKELREKSEGKCKLGDIAKEVTTRWAALSPEDKKVYEDKAAADKQRYVEEMRAYQEACDPAGALRKKYEHLMPKRPPTAAAKYQQDAAVREKAEQQLKAVGQEATQKQIDAKIKELWKAAGEEEKKPFEDQAAKDKSEFFQKQKEWQATPEFKEIEEAEKLMEAKAKAAEAEEKAKVDKENAKPSAKKARKSDKESSPPAKTTPSKRQQKEQPKKDAAPASEQKRARKTKEEATAGMFLDAGVVAEAAKLNLEAALRNLAGRAEVASSGKKPSDLLAALKSSGGLVNPAKRALLGVA